MKWKVIAKSVMGTSHEHTGKGCEDAVESRVIELPDQSEVLICCVSDGAGSARYAGEAAALTTRTMVEAFQQQVLENKEIDENSTRLVLETVYDTLQQQAFENGTALNEYSCTCIAAVIFESKAIFLQIGDGVIVREDGGGFYTPVFWPYNDEYLNSTSFLIDNINFPFLKVLCIDHCINELSLMTDGLQNLTLNNESQSVHQPFFSELFKWLRVANHHEQVTILQGKLEGYLHSPIINSRTDDDKTLLLATRFTS